jgi:hypothetical protein
MCNYIVFIIITLNVFTAAVRKVIQTKRKAGLIRTKILKTAIEAKTFVRLRILIKIRLFLLSFYLPKRKALKLFKNK